MKTDIDTMKHECVGAFMTFYGILKIIWFRIQMDVDNRKTESKTGLKRMDIAMEVCVPQ